jgi:hypothetical protein
VKGMCKASKYLDQLETLVKGIESDRKMLFEKLSKYDLMLSEHYHKVEVMNFNACEGYYLSNQLQEILRKRRIVKDEISRLTTLNQTLNLKTINNSLKKSKECITKAKKKSAEWQHDWKYTYSLEEVLH